ncbi:PrsW family intramembrane metalloprotease [bacterium SCSIO 12741]|nr:PrsW family intramembrane metalloprotease [bacterium SCSIO 12741]
MQFVLYLIFNLIGLYLIGVWVVNTWRLYLHAADKSQFFTWRRFGFGITLGALVVLPLLSINLFFDSSKFDSLSEEREFYMREGNDYQVFRLTEEMLLKDPLNRDLNFEWLVWHEKRLSNRNAYWTVGYYYLTLTDESDRIQKYYEELAERHPEFARLYLGLLYAFHVQPDEARKYLKAEPEDLKYEHFVRGMVALVDHEYIEAQKWFLQEVAVPEGYHQGAYYRLAESLYRSSEREALRALVYDEKAREYIPSSLNRSVFFHKLDFVNYFKEVIRNDFRRFYLPGFLVALMITLVWGYYIYRLDIYEPERWYHLLLVFTMSCGTIYLVYPISDMLGDMGFSLNGNPINDFFYCVIGIGMVEEFVKLLPILVMIRFTRAINEPYDYILYGALSALAFALIENIGYIEYGKITNIPARAFVAAVGHMMFTSVACYGLLLSKYRYQVNKYLFVGMFFFFASLAHGFYDFWLINSWASQFSIVTMLFFIISVHFWFIMKNNAINISNFYTWKKRLNNRKLQSYLILSLTAILMTSYLFYGMRYGRSEANHYFQKEVYNYGFIIYYLAFSFSRFSMVRGQWNQFSLSRIFVLPSLRVPPDFTGVRLSIQLPLKRSQSVGLKAWDLSLHFPMKGVLREKRSVSGEVHWYLFEADREFPVLGFEGKKVLIKTNRPNNPDNFKTATPILIYLVPGEFLLSQPHIQKRQLKKWAFCHATLVE